MEECVSRVVANREPDIEDVGEVGEVVPEPGGLFRTGEGASGGETLILDIDGTRAVRLT